MQARACPSGLGTRVHLGPAQPCTNYSRPMQARNDEVPVVAVNDQRPPARRGDARTNDWCICPPAPAGGARGTAHPRRASQAASPGAGLCFGGKSSACRLPGRSGGLARQRRSAIFARRGAGAPRALWPPHGCSCTWPGNLGAPAASAHANACMLRRTCTALMPMGWQQGAGACAALQQPGVQARAPGHHRRAGGARRAQPVHDDLFGDFAER